MNIFLWAAAALLVLLILVDDILRSREAKRIEKELREKGLIK